MSARYRTIARIIASVPAADGAGVSEGELDAQLPAGHAAFVYLYEGGGAIDGQALALQGVATLTDGDRIAVRAGPEGARFLLLAAEPIGEPVVQYGPFVMTSREEVEQALADYRDGALTGAEPR